MSKHNTKTTGSCKICDDTGLSPYRHPEEREPCPECGGAVEAPEEFTQTFGDDWPWYGPGGRREEMLDAAGVSVRRRKGREANDNEPGCPSFEDVWPSTKEDA